MPLQHVSEFKYLGCILDESGTEETECRRKVASGWRVAGATRSLVNARGLQLECPRVLHEALFVPVFMYGRDTTKWKEKGKFRIRAVQVDNRIGLLCIRKIDKVSNAWIGEL